MKSKAKEFKDKNRQVIKAGDILKHEFYARSRERAGYKRVAGFAKKPNA